MVKSPILDKSKNRIKNLTSVRRRDGGTYLQRCKNASIYANLKKQSNMKKNKKMGENGKKMGGRREAAMRNQTVKDSRGKEGKWEEFRAQAKGLSDK